MAGSFLKAHDQSDGGLMIETGGKSWNSHETFDTVFNMACWFAAAVLASGMYY